MSTIEELKSIFRQSELVTLSDLAQQTHSSFRAVKKFLKEASLKFTSIGDQKKEVLRKELTKRTPLYEIVKKLKICPASVYHIAQGAGISLRDFQHAFSELELQTLQDSLPEEKEKRMLTLIREGLAYKRIGQQIGVTREYVRQSILGWGLHTAWNDAKYKEENIRTQLVSLLDTRTRQLLHNPSLSWGERKAYEYNLSSLCGTSERAIPHEKLTKLFTLYDDAYNNGEKLSLDELAERSGFSSPKRVNKIFFRLNISSMYGARRFKKTSPEKRKSLKKVSRLGYLTFSDLAHFSGLSSPAVTRYVDTEIQAKRTPPINFGKRRTLSYSKASAVYEAQDVGFSVSEIAELVGTIPRIVEYAEQHRSTLEPRITNALRILFPNANIARPYYNPNFRDIYN